MSTLAPLLGDKRTSNAANPSIPIYKYAAWWPRSKSGRGPPKERCANRTSNPLKQNVNFIEPIQQI